MQLASAIIISGHVRMRLNRIFIYYLKIWEYLAYLITHEKAGVQPQAVSAGAVIGYGNVLPQVVLPEE